VNDEPLRILLVCLGNVCRSPLAERVLRMRLDELLGERASMVEVSSAGVRALVGHPMDDRAAAELVRLGGDPEGFAATQLTENMVKDADVVLTASTTVRSLVLAQAPRAMSRTFTIREFASLISADGPRPLEGDLVAHAASLRGSVPVIDFDVRDPIGQSRRVHRRVADLLDESCTTIARAVAEWVLTARGAGS
jgi:protein-tyrosine phosphatase